MFHRAAHFTVLAFADGHADPAIITFLAIEHGFNRACHNAVNFDAILQRIKLVLGDAAIGAGAVAARKPCLGMFKLTRKLSVIGEQQQPFGVQIKPPYGNHAAKLFRQAVKDGEAAFLVLMRGHKPCGFMVAPEPRWLLCSNGFIVKQDFVFACDFKGGGVQGLAIDFNAARFDEFLCIAA